MKKISLAILLTLLVAAQSRALDGTGPGDGQLMEKKNIAYLETGGKKLKGDIYRPAGDAMLPGVVVIHGGGFLFGSKDMEHYTRISREIAADGYVVFNIDYRLIQEGGRFPASVKDAKCAVRWMRAHSVEFNADPHRIGVVGGSAGGYLAAFLAATGDSEEFEPACDYGGDMSTRVHAAVIFFGLTDLRADSPDAQTFRLLLPRFLDDKNAGENTELQLRASPFTYAADSEPVLLLHGAADKLVSVEQSKNLCAEIKKAGRVCEMRIFDGVDHAFITDPESEPTLTSMKEIKSFFNIYLKGEIDPLKPVMR